MGRRAKSQWEFGELFPEEEVRKVLTVSELTGKVRKTLESGIGSVWVSGEITNLRRQSSGHIYFALKDADAQLSCVLFRNKEVGHRGRLEDGVEVLLFGQLTVYEARGQYQLIVEDLELKGVGALQIAFEKLKQKLAAEGLFDAATRRPLPRFPSRIGIVTSPTAAALQDVLHVIERRDPGLEIYLSPCRVQGDGAAREIVRAIRRLNRFSKSGTGKPLDLILLTRGGGSIEDLWAFNEEIVARAIRASDLPVITGVGHEIDFTIADFAADHRAITPSAAAEIITEDVYSSRGFVENARDRMRQLLVRHLSDCRLQAGEVSRRLARLHPRRVLEGRMQRIDDLETDLRDLITRRLVEADSRLLQARAALARQRPRNVIAQRRDHLENRRLEMRRSLATSLAEYRRRLELAASKLSLLSPEHILNRGYSITTEAATGRVIRQAAQVTEGTRLETRLQDGTLHSVVTKPDTP